MNIFVGNLLFEATEANLKKVFAPFGNIASVSIVMEKNGKKSRGFGFVDMPDDREAQAAIDALDGKELMGRPLHISPVHPKSEGEREAERKKRKEERLKAKIQQKAAQKVEGQDKAWFAPVFNKSGGYKGGRRSRSYAKKLAAAGITTLPKPRGKNRENPLRWRKKKPWVKKTQGEASPHEKAEGENKPGHKSNERPRQSRFKSRKN